jgi:hypothetical protein
MKIEFMNRGVAETNEIYEKAAVLFQASQNKSTEIKSKLQQDVTKHRDQEQVTTGCDQTPRSRASYNRM